jgi:YacP-like NYN domain
VLIVDVANLLHVLTRGRFPGDRDVLELVGWLATSRYAKREVTLVCDGNPMRASGLRDQVVLALAAAGNTRQLLFAGPNQQADDVVEGLLEHGPGVAKGGVVVVSSDRRLRDAARRVGAQSLRSEEFAEQLHDDARRRAFARESSREVAAGTISAAAWAAYFGVDLGTGEATRVPGAARDGAAGANLTRTTNTRAPRPSKTDNASRAMRHADDERQQRVDCQAAALDALQTQLHATLHGGVRELGDIEPSQLDMELWLTQFPADKSGKAHRTSSRDVTPNKRARRTQGK